MKKMLCIFFIIFLNAASAISAKQKVIYGWIEPVKIYPYRVTMIAKLDTGAKTASIDAKQIKYYRYKGKQYVRFQFYYQKNKKLTVEKPVIRFVRIRSQNNGIKLTRRPVVKFRICMGYQSRVIDVNLVNRTGFKYRLLLGRKALKQLSALVDSSRKMTKNARCRY